jgi:hypothetical protein
MLLRNLQFALGAKGCAALGVEDSQQEVLQHPAQKAGTATMNSFTLRFTDLGESAVEIEYPFEVESLSIGEVQLCQEISAVLFGHAVDPCPTDSEIVIDEVAKTFVKAHVVKIVTNEDVSQHLDRLAVRQYDVSADEITIVFETHYQDTINMLAHLYGEPKEEESTERGGAFFRFASRTLAKTAGGAALREIWDRTAVDAAHTRVTQTVTGGSITSSRSSELTTARVSHGPASVAASREREIVFQTNTNTSREAGGGAVATTSTCSAADNVAFEARVGPVGVNASLRKSASLEEHSDGTVSTARATAQATVAHVAISVGPTTTTFTNTATTTTQAASGNEAPTTTKENSSNIAFSKPAAK